MNYQPSLPEHNDNVSHNHPLKEFFLLLGGLAVIILLVFWCLGFFVDFAVSRISPENEAIIFAKANLLWEGKVDSTSVRQSALQNLVDDLSKCVEINYPVKVWLVESEQVNALAFPGGNIVVYSGLLDRMKSENGLAFVFAHELAHFKNRDHLRSMGRGIVLVALSSLLTGANSGISQMLAPTGELGQAQYSQSRESKADETALQALNCNYGHVGGATELFEALNASEGGIGLGVLHYFSSHPEMQARIGELNQLAKEMDYRVKEVKEFKF